MPFSGASGPHNAKIMFVLEAWGEREAELGKPLVGASGQETIRLCLESGLSKDTALAESIISGMWRDAKMNPHSMLSLRELWLDKASMLWTNVFNLRPSYDSNDIKLLCASKKEVGGAAYPYAPFSQGKYFRPEFFPHIERLKQEIETVKPNLILACGGTATWALLGSSAITAIRGAATECKLVPGIKVLPTYHPASIFRKWDWRPVILADLMKAAREREFPEIIRPRRRVLINPTLAELYAFEAELNTPAKRDCILSVDIETKAKQITCLCFADSSERSVVIPFWGPNPARPHYWATPQEEVAAWSLAGRLLAGPWPKLFQNGMYDLQYLARMGFKVMNCREDTMLLHHSLFPELPKGLGFMGSIYTNEAAWKLMNRVKKEDALKRDE